MSSPSIPYGGGLSTFPVTRASSNPSGRSAESGRLCHGSGVCSCAAEVEACAGRFVKAVVMEVNHSPVTAEEPTISLLRRGSWTVVPQGVGGWVGGEGWPSLRSFSSSEGTPVSVAAASRVLQQGRAGLLSVDRTGPSTSKRSSLLLLPQVDHRRGGEGALVLLLHAPTTPA